MSVSDAITILDNVTAQVAMPRAGHVQTQVALDIIREALSLPMDPEGDSADE